MTFKVQIEKGHKAELLKRKNNYTFAWFKLVNLL